jgi:hypothetical protein
MESSGSRLTIQAERGPNMVTAKTHERSVHVDAPVEVVFGHVRDPLNFMAADPQPVRIDKLALTPEGVGSTWESRWHVAGVPMHAVWTREQCVPCERIVDHTTTGMVWTYTTAPDATGTTLSLSYAISTRLAAANWILDHAFGDQSSQLDAMLAHFKAAIETSVRSGPEGDGR